jgi:hypothetical protein
MAKSKPCQSPTAKLQPVQIHEHAPASTIKGRSCQRGRSRRRGQCTGERQVGGTHDDGKRRLSTLPPSLSGDNHSHEKRIVLGRKAYGAERRTTTPRIALDLRRSP